MTISAVLCKWPLEITNNGQKTETDRLVHYRPVKTASAELNKHIRYLCKSGGKMKLSTIKAKKKVYDMLQKKTEPVLDYFKNITVMFDFKLGHDFSDLKDSYRSLVLFKLFSSACYNKL